MSLLSRMAAPASAQDVAGLVAALLSSRERAAPKVLPGAARPSRPAIPAVPVPSAVPALPVPSAEPPAEPAPASAAVSGRIATGPTGLGNSAARIPAAALPRPPEPRVAAEAAAATAPLVPGAPTGLGTTAARPAPARPADTSATGGARAPDEEPSGSPAAPQLYCLPAVRDPALGELVNDRLVEWAEETGLYPGRLDKVSSAGFGRLIMLAHPESDDPERLLAAAK